MFNPLRDTSQVETRRSKFKLILFSFATALIAGGFVIFGMLRMDAPLDLTLAVATVMTFLIFFIVLSYNQQKIGQSFIEFN